MNGRKPKLFYGKHRGTVINNIDPMQLGRLLVQVPDVLGLTTSSWAMPSVPIAGTQMGMYAIPQVGTGVWVEFEHGDADYPVWTGCWWGSGSEVPNLGLGTPSPIPHIVLQTTLQNAILVSDLPGPTGGIMLKLSTGAMITINDTGITIQNGQGASIALVGPSVSINNGALTIT